MSLPRDPERDLERLLEDDGGELGALYRRLPKAEPPRRLDRSVLGEAARAVHGHTPRRQRWLVGLGSAAGIVLAAGLAWHVGQDALRQETQSTASPPARPTYVPVEPISEMAQRRAREEVPSQDATRAAPASAPAGAAPPALPRPTAPMHKSESRAKDSAPAPQPRPAPATPPPPVAPAEPAAQAFPTDSADRAQGVDQMGLSAGAAKAAAPEAERKEVEHERLRNAAPAPSSSVELRRDMQLAPDEWLSHIRQLMHQGRRQQAGESLRLFRNAHPERVVPQDLRALLD